MAVFRWRHFAGEIILWAVRWYCRYGISYRELEEMMGERGVAVDHTTLYRWTQRYAPELEKRSAWYRSRLSAPSIFRPAPKILTTEIFATEPSPLPCAKRSSSRTTRQHGWRCCLSPK